VWGLFGVLLPFASSGCGASAASTTVVNPDGSTRITMVTHEKCDVAGSNAETLDANGDGRSDVTTVIVGGTAKCRGTDLDFNGKIEIWSYFDQAGKLRRRELDFDGDGRIDEVDSYASGVLVSKLRSTGPGSAVDTWETYVGGRLTRAERDSDGNGRVDQWWDYPSADCPIIRSDVDGNGEPDPGAVVNYCADTNYRPPEQPDQTPASVLQKETQALPTETSVPAAGAAESQAEGDNAEVPASATGTKPKAGGAGKKGGTP
jgi:hypothetical protein